MHLIKTINGINYEGANISIRDTNLQQQTLKSAPLNNMQSERGQIIIIETNGIRQILFKTVCHGKHNT